jgi:hypothetical protein
MTFVLQLLTFPTHALRLFFLRFSFSFAFSPMQRISAANVCSHSFLAGAQCRCTESFLAFSFLSLQSYPVFLLMQPPTLRCRHLRNSTHHRFLQQEGLGAERHAAILLYL